MVRNNFIQMYSYTRNDQQRVSNTFKVLTRAAALKIIIKYHQSMMAVIAP